MSTLPASITFHRPPEQPPPPLTTATDGFVPWRVSIVVGMAALITLVIAAIAFSEPGYMDAYY